MLNSQVNYGINKCPRSKDVFLLSVRMRLKLKYNMIGNFRNDIFF